MTQGGDKKKAPNQMMKISSVSGLECTKSLSTPVGLEEVSGLWLQPKGQEKGGCKTGGPCRVHAPKSKMGCQKLLTILGGCGRWEGEIKQRGDVRSTTRTRKHVWEEA